MKRNLRKCLTGVLLSLVMSVSLFPETASAATGPELSGKSELMAENDKAALYFDGDTSQVSVLYKDTGQVVNTKVLDDASGNATYKNYQKSDVIIGYYPNKDSRSATLLNNYEKSISAGQFETEKIENGFRIVYTLAENKLSMDCVPKYISEERMNGMVMEHLSTKEREWIGDYYRAFNGRYTRTKDTGVTQSVIKELYRLFYEVGTYTDEDLLQDNEENAYESNWSNLEVHITFEYVLDGTDLLVRIPVDEFTANSEDFILNSLSVLPYFLSSTTEEEGCIVVPDGSGAVIGFNNGLTKGNNYVSRVYGKDILIGAEQYDSTEYYATMPIIGMVYEDYAYLAIVEKGDAMAEINARVSGKYDDYNTAYFRFYITEAENVATSASAAVTYNKFTGDTYDEDIVIRYRMLQDKDQLNYTGIAKAYQNYLIEKGVLSRRAHEENAGLYLEVLGAAVEAKNFLGVPYEGMKALTTFSEMQEMLHYFQLQGVEDMKVQLTGWANGGENNTALTGVSMEGVLGSKNELKGLIDYMGESGYALYPSLNFQTMSSSGSKSFAKNNASRFLSAEYARLALDELGLNDPMVMKKSPYLLSPNNLQKYTKKALSKLEKYNFDGLCVDDIGSQLVPDYSVKKPVSRDSAMKIEQQALAQIGEKYDLMLSNSYAYSWQYADELVDIPVRSNEYNIFDYDIPLLQLVLDGCIPYSTEALNNNTQQSDGQMILKCIETRMNPKYLLIYSDMDELEMTTDYYDLLSVNYDTWKKRVVSLYKEYNAFYQKVKDADIAMHETISRGVTKVTYTNGAVVYVNNNTKASRVDGHNLSAFSYLVVE